MIRKFYLESYAGERLSMQTKELFFRDPAGLGYTDEREYFEVSYGFYAESNKRYEQPNPTGVFIFMRGDKYVNYGDLVQWLFNAEPVRLVYQPTTHRDDLLMDIDIETLDLSEKAQYGGLEIPASIRGKSPYYYRNPRTFVFEQNTISTPKQYGRGGGPLGYRYPYRYATSTAEDAFEFTARGHFPAALDLTMNGPISDPILRAVGRYSGEEFGLLTLQGVTLSQGEQIYWSSRPNETGVWMIAGGARIDLIDALDLANNNFFTVPTGEVVQISLRAQIDPTYTEPITHTLRLHEYFKG